MSKFTRLMGTACVLAMAAFAGSPAVAGPIGSITAHVETGYDRITQQHSSDFNEWFLGGAVGGSTPFAGINVQADGYYVHDWANHASAERWNGGGDLFWAGMESRAGLDAHGAHFHQNGFNLDAYNVGGFLEWYIDNVTVGGKAGYVWTTPSQGAHGNYVGINASFYFIPDLAVTGLFNWLDVTGSSCGGLCRVDFRDNTYGIAGEYLFDEGMPVTVGASFNYDDFGGRGAGHFHTETWMLRLRWYTGGGSLMDHHRNGLLNDALVGPFAGPSGTSF